MPPKLDDYFEEERPLRPGGMFTSYWKRLLTDHLNDCYRQRRVFREALNDMRAEFISHTDSMHAQNQEKMGEIEKQIEAGNSRLDASNARLESMQKYIFVGVISLLLSVLGWFVTHFGPFASHI